jgi:hypothetical protein
MFNFFRKNKSVDSLLAQAEKSAKNALKESISKHELELIDSKFQEISFILNKSNLPKESKNLVKCAIEKVCRDFSLGRIDYISASKSFYKIEKKITELQVISSHI